MPFLGALVSLTKVKLADAFFSHLNIRTFYYVYPTGRRPYSLCQFAFCMTVLSPCCLVFTVGLGYGDFKNCYWDLAAKRYGTQYISENYLLKLFPIILRRFVRSYIQHSKLPKQIFRKNCVTASKNEEFCADFEYVDIIFTRSLKKQSQRKRKFES